MKKAMERLGLAFMMMVTTAGLAVASETTGQAAETTAATGDSTWFFVACVVSAALGLSVAAFGSALAQGNAISKAVEGIARQPEASGSIQTVIDTVARLNRADSSGNRRVRIHTVGFPVQFSGNRLSINAVRYAALMRKLAEDNGGSFVGLNSTRP